MITFNLNDFKTAPQPEKKAKLPALKQVLTEKALPLTSEDADSLVEVLLALFDGVNKDELTSKADIVSILHGLVTEKKATSFTASSTEKLVDFALLSKNINSTDEQTVNNILEILVELSRDETKVGTLIDKEVLKHTSQLSENQGNSSFVKEKLIEIVNNCFKFPDAVSKIQRIHIPNVIKHVWYFLQDTTILSIHKMGQDAASSMVKYFEKANWELLHPMNPPDILLFFLQFLTRLSYEQGFDDVLFFANATKPLLDLLVNTVRDDVRVQSLTILGRILPAKEPLVWETIGTAGFNESLINCLTLTGEHCIVTKECLKYIDLLIHLQEFTVDHMLCLFSKGVFNKVAIFAGRVCRMTNAEVHAAEKDCLPIALNILSEVLSDLVSEFDCLKDKLQKSVKESPVFTELTALKNHKLSLDIETEQTVLEVLLMYKEFCQQYEIPEVTATAVQSPPPVLAATASKEE